MERFRIFVENKAQQIFYKTGLHIARRPKTFLFSILLSTALLATGAVNFHEHNNVREDFSADDSPSRYEYAVTEDFFRNFGSPFHVVVAMKAADGGSLLRPKYLDKVIETEDYLQSKLSVSFDGRQITYSDFCESYCETSDVVSIFLNMYREVHIRKKGNVKLTYPSMDVFGNRIYLANNIFQVELNNKSHIIEGCRMIAINFQAIQKNASSVEIMNRWEHEVFIFSESTKNDSLIRVYATSEGLVSKEVRRTGLQALPFITVSFVAVLLFTVITSLKKDPITSKPWEAAFGVFCPILSLVASFGLLFWCNFPFLPIVCVIPFLVLAIGVDDVFIFLHCYHQTDPRLPVEERIGKMLAEAGPSITITSLTNFLSFAISIFTPTPAIQIFSAYISVAVVFDYTYQIFLYSAILTFGAHREKKRLHAFIPCMSIAETEKRSVKTQSDISGTLEELMNNFVDLWVNIAMSNITRIIVACFMIVYCIVATHGVMQIKVGLTSEKLFSYDSPLLPFVKLQTEIIFKEGGQVAVFVNNPGDMRKPEIIPEVMRLVNDFEHATGSIGSASTHLWFIPYLSYVGIQERGEIGFKYKYLPEFMKLREYHSWNSFVNLGATDDCMNEKPTCLQKFFFSTGFRNAVQWSERLQLLQEWRDIAAHYSKFNVSIYEPFSMYADQLLTIVPVTKSTVIFAFVVMALVLTTFTPSITTIVSSTLSILSINLGVLGSLTYWNIDLDPISMATILMAIGFSVDFIAHITFHYYKGQTKGKHERLKHALKSIAWPMTQAGISTILCLCVLGVIQAYMVKVFVKVVIIVVVLGLLHGLIILPVVFGAIPLRKRIVTDIDKVSPSSALQKNHTIRIAVPAATPITTRRNELEKQISAGPRYHDSRG
ncbi:Patched family protein [Brugia malayi]|uniref:BMA-PTR-18 n=2 Tax=Brugia malayi TaxID=6279 RepID=A0A1P6BIP2_BRUMA|nr:Patched family protein [Brugia malayi]CTP81537.1 BMA-PTR-18 [Brugia malayi]VIO94627.1 Patched family protein [Brugia malayi]